jgi:hypothetical protein
MEGVAAGDEHLITCFAFRRLPNIQQLGVYAKHHDIALHFARRWRKSLSKSCSGRAVLSSKLFRIQ